MSIPPAVAAEVAYWTPAWSKPDWLNVEPLVEPHATAADAWRQAGLLDSGEAEAVALARRLGADWFLTDDAAGRLLAQTLRLEVHGSLGVVRWAAAGHLGRTRAATILDGLANSSLWLSARVLAEARAALEQLFPG